MGLHRELGALATTLALTGALSGPAISAPAAPGAGALVINDQGCTFLDGNGHFAVLDADHTVITPSREDLTCTGTVAASSTGKAVGYDYASTGLLCNGSARWNETVSKNGNAQLTCPARRR
jgi:hypothetical protein